MAEGESGEDKKHAPTERRLAQAAEQGDVLRSTDLPRAAAIVLVVTAGLGAGAGLGNRLEALLAACLSQAGQTSLQGAASWAQGFADALGPLLALIGGLSLAASFATGGFVFALQKLSPDLSQISPSHGLGQMFSRQGMIETGKSLLKFIVIGGVGALMIWRGAPRIEALAGASHPSGGLVIGLCLQMLIAVAAVIAALAGADVGLQYWLHRQKLRMSDSELRAEMKEVVGNPHVRQRQRALARRMARARQMRRIPEASVVVTNPTHFAVAIRYRRGTDVAPLMLAKGVGLMAEEIISRARGHGIPVVEAAPLARAFYRHVEPGDHIPVALYRACAEVLAYVWRMQHWRAQGGEKPRPPTQVPVPDELVVPPQ
jgi:flagellar biosynthetic protein FlhB